MGNRDVEELKKTERDTALLAAIVESSDDAIYSVSLLGAILSWNPAAERIYGFSQEEIRGQDLTLIVPEKRRDEFPKLLAAIQDGQAVSNFLTSHQSKSGNEVLLSLTVSPIKDASGRVTRASIVARDIAENEKARIVKEVILAERAGLLERLQLQMECMPIACVLADPQNHFTYWNPAAERTFGYFFKEVEGKRLVETLIAPSDLSRAEASYERLQKGELTIQGEVSEHRRKDGKTIFCEWYVTPMRDSKGNLLGNMGMALDITERRKAEAGTVPIGGHFAANHRRGHGQRPRGPGLQLEPGRGKYVRDTISRKSSASPPRCWCLPIGRRKWRRSGSWRRRKKMSRTMKR